MVITRLRGYWYIVESTDADGFETSGETLTVFDTQSGVTIDDRIEVAGQDVERTQRELAALQFLKSELENGECVTTIAPAVLYL